MTKRLALALPVLFMTFLVGCAQQQSSHVFSGDQVTLQTLEKSAHDMTSFGRYDARQPLQGMMSTPTTANHSVPYTLPVLADSMIERGLKLMGTPYRYGGTSQRTGFDCSGFIGFLFSKEGIDLPRSTREMIKLEAPLVARNELEPGDLIFFNNRGRGQVSHAGIYMGDNRFIHSSSTRSGGVRVDRLDVGYWKDSYLQAKRVLPQDTPAVR